MHSICYFASYFKGDKIPYYLRFYLQEVKLHFSEVVYVSGNERLDEESKNFLKETGITLQQEKNEGFDFGLWYKAFQKNDPVNYDRIALINDSSVLFKPLAEFFDWMDKTPLDVYGMTESSAVSRHLQSYFLVFSKQTIPFVKQYLQEHGLKNSIHEVISEYEIGLSKTLLKNGFKLGAFVSNAGYEGEFSPYYYLLEEHIKQGIPLVKKKIVYSSYRDSELKTLARMGFNINIHHYIQLINKHNPNTKLIDFNKVLSGQKNEMGDMKRFAYQVKTLLYRLFRPIWRMIRK